jgi:hypothetical protein
MRAVIINYGIAFRSVQREVTRMRKQVRRCATRFVMHQVAKSKHVQLQRIDAVEQPMILGGCDF